MKTRLMGPTGIPVSVIGQGTWYLEQSDRREAIQAVRRGLELGMTHIDTAEMYGSGEVERMVGEGIAGHRPEVFLASKVLPEHASYKGTLRGCEASLKRLRTEYLDLYLLHWAGRYPLAETIRAFEQLVSDGKVRAYGVSNFDPGEIEEAVSIAGPEKIACNQVLYHLRQRAIEHGVIPACEKHGIAVVAYSPFGSGRFPSHNTPQAGKSWRRSPHRTEPRPIRSPSRFLRSGKIFLPSQKLRRPAMSRRTPKPQTSSYRKKTSTISNTPSRSAHARGDCRPYRDLHPYKKMWDGKT